MFMTNLPAALRISSLHEAVLGAALEDRPESARDAWEEVQARASLDELGYEAFELLPLVYRNVGHADDAVSSRLKGVYRRTWVKNNLLAQRTNETSAALVEAGIRALFVEGIVLASRFYPEVGLRPTSSIDVLLDPRHRDNASSVLARAGWREPPGTHRRRDDVQYLYDVNRNVCALRTTLALDARAPRDPSLLFEAAERHRIRHVEVSVPTPTETLFAVIVQHARLVDVPNVQWIADAKMVIRAGIDWHRLVALSDEYGQLLRLRDALTLLARLPGAQPPRELWAELAGIRVSARERLAYFCTNGSMTGPGRLPALIAKHVAATAETSTLAAIAAFPDFLKEHWELGRSREVPRAAGARALRHLGRRRDHA
jgi:hypothetical protein